MLKNGLRDFLDFPAQFYFFVHICYFCKVFVSINSAHTVWRAFSIHSVMLNKQYIFFLLLPPWNIVSVKWLAIHTQYFFIINCVISYVLTLFLFLFFSYLCSTLDISTDNKPWALHSMRKSLRVSQCDFIRGAEGIGTGEFDKLVWETKDVPACSNFLDILRWWLRINIFCGWERVHMFWAKMIQVRMK